MFNLWLAVARASNPRELFHTYSPDESYMKEVAFCIGEIPEDWKKHWESDDWLKKFEVSREAADQKWGKLVSQLACGDDDAKLVLREFFDIIRWILKIDPRERPSAEEVLKHPWLSVDREDEDIDPKTVMQPRTEPVRRVLAHSGPPPEDDDYYRDL
ncbi:serine/threonine protein kinase [Coprinopsis cinerea okayama7|uniref:Serine/threonine protein kinase n=1 Tax=Coprinopsis cinerea (strain Okayama-7 / 130 / ATCC MYA-4618 / FGSC 9003) TaxID=240176 RepID=A8NJ35_COPC7|nr:serine/threonine protein kinase [Coprinopsis cinerea okayama7\|eukprot:XP_001834139.2 serine/threonine protein kinase [Coprinopsis cinerea okayama7\